MRIVSITEEVHEQAISSVMERVEIHIEVFDIEYVLNKGTIVF